MALDLTRLLDPKYAAVITSECQEGVIGPSSVLPALAAVASASMIPAIHGLVVAARSAGVPVVHCVAGRRPDDRGANQNARLFGAVLKSAVRIDMGSAAASVVAGIGVEPTDFLMSRIHGLSPMSGTELDPVLRNLGVRTLVVTGVSINVAITNLVMDAVNRGYQVVLPRDAVAGVPVDYADAVIDNTLALLATVTTSAAVVAAWNR